jgi:dipeptide/tripeptide permease
MPIPTSRKPLWNLTLLSISLFLQAAPGSHLSVIPRLLENDLQLSEMETNAIMGYFGAGIVFAYVIGGLITDRITGTKWGAITGGLLHATGFFLLAFTPQIMLYPALISIVIGTGLQF